MNAIRRELSLGERTIQAVELDVARVAQILDHRLQDPEVAKDGWLWADLGDAHTLLGNSASAEGSYVAFARKAGGDERRIARESIEKLRRQLNEHDDPGAQRLDRGLEAFDRAVTKARPQG
jgi:hypothetical protein